MERCITFSRDFVFGGRCYLARVLRKRWWNGGTSREEHTATESYWLAPAAAICRTASIYNASLVGRTVSGSTWSRPAQRKQVDTYHELRYVSCNTGAAQPSIVVSFSSIQIETYIADQSHFSYKARRLVDAMEERRQQQCRSCIQLQDLATLGAESGCVARKKGEAFPTPGIGHNCVQTQHELGLENTVLSA